ncbi:hypothetical protein [Streptomyces zaomyceticus]|uniref:hypothetical protein n=1 Tax=Streptomyces zaomyceticus TaxID=68286 RepID=UPI00343059A0
MHDLIRRLASWLSLFFAPLPYRPDPPAHPAASTLQPPSPLPHLRSPYGREPHTIDADASPLVRPYLAAHEQESARQRRRLALVLAADFGIDLDRHVVGMPGVAF